jgi:hypothetical protein
MYMHMLYFCHLDSEGQRNKYSMIQYLFEGPEIDIKIKLHGNSKGDRAFSDSHFNKETYPAADFLKHTESSGF